MSKNAAQSSVPPATPVGETDWAKVDAHIITQEEYGESPELDDDFFERAEIRIGDKVIRSGRPKSRDPKMHVSLRLPRHVLDHVKAGGPGWPTRIDRALRDHVNVERAKRSVALDAGERAAREAAKTAAE